MTTDTSITIGARNGHAYCLMCGDRNPHSIGLRFRAEDDDTVCAEFHSHHRLQGYNGIVHGGVISALLDAAMTHCLFHRGVRAVTGDLHIRFLKPVASGSLLNLRARIRRVRAPLYLVEAEIVCDGCVMATAEAKFMRYDEKRRYPPDAGQ